VKEYPMERELYSPKEVAELLGIHENTLYKWRVLGEGPPYLRLSSHGRVRYERESLRAWWAHRFALQAS
jgi:predicted DNA-binding transcriptional regulator AlpA